MIFLEAVIIFLCGVLVGGMLFKTINKHLEKSKVLKQTTKINNQFKQLLSNISRGKSVFKNRVNNTAIGKSNTRYRNGI